MVQFDKRIDAYVENARDFAKPILNYLRSAVHKACPDVRETIKWGSPHFEYEGKILCAMASFHSHSAFVFRLGSMMKDPRGLMQTTGEKTGMGHFGRIKDVKDLPTEKVLIQYIKEAMSLTEMGVKVPKAKASARKELVVPDDFIKVLKKNKMAYANFQDFTYSNKKEYVEWITEAKTSETRDKRIATSVEWLEEGKARNWKYMK
jgi:uncharacterized protein YdeI (YjbR/CyaY-like superfamily)